MSYPNQYHITVKKCPRDNGKTFVYMSTDALQEAMNRLQQRRSLLLWLYLARNQTKYEFDLSPEACMQWGLSESSYHRACADLINAGYLRCTGGDNYIFVESPQLDSELPFVEIEEFPQRKRQTPQKSDSVIPNLPGLKDGVSFQLKNVKCSI